MIASVSSELERRRREGAMRLEEAEREKRAHESEKDRERRAEDDARMRLAVGRYRFRGLRNVIFWAAMPGMVVFALGLGSAALEVFEDVGGPMIFGGLIWMFGGLWLWGSEIVWRAGAGTMEAERQWLRTAPFPVTGYFEWLARYASSSGSSLYFTVRGEHLGARREELLQLVASVHPAVKIEDEAKWDGGVHFAVSEITGRDDDQRARIVHDLIDRVLVAVHHETPITALEIRER
jgi:hypothetical protein